MKTKTKHWASITAGMLSLAGYSSAASPGSEKYSYDASGNLTEKSIGDQTTKMAYQDNRLLSTTNADIKDTPIYDKAGRPTTIANRQMAYGYGDKVLRSESVGKKTDLFYNSEGNLVAKSTNGETSTYTWDGISLAAQDGRAFTNETHITGGVPVLQDGQDAMISDYLGNTLVAGEQQFTSTAYGEGQERARFTSKPFINELNGFIFPFRLYSASTAKWSTVDPLGYPDGSNNTAYVNNNPTGDVDPLGLLGAAGAPVGAGTWSWTTPGNVNISFDVDEYNVTCDDGVTKAQCFKPKAGVTSPGTDYDITHNCHGYALGGCLYLIPPRSLENIKKGDKWSTVSETKMKTDGTGKYVARCIQDHSAKVITINPGPPVKVALVGGKASLMKEIRKTLPDKQWNDVATNGRPIIQYGAVAEYWEK
jgi:RHS repeat-associated protein